MHQSNSNEISVLYCTVKNLAEAECLAESLIFEGLAACVNILPSGISVYCWNGCVEKASEVALVIKTSCDQSKRCQERIKELHSYEIPCIIEFPKCRANQNYIDWVHSQVKI